MKREDVIKDKLKCKKGKHSRKKIYSNHFFTAPYNYRLKQILSKVFILLILRSAIISLAFNMSCKEVFMLLRTSAEHFKIFDRINIFSPLRALSFTKEILLHNETWTITSVI